MDVSSVTMIWDGPGAGEGMLRQGLGGRVVVAEIGAQFPAVMQLTEEEQVGEIFKWQSPQIWVG